MVQQNKTTDCQYPVYKELASKTNLMNLKKETNVVKKLSSGGIKPSSNQPIKIIVQKN